MNNILKASILTMIIGAALLLSENIYILIFFGLGLFTLSFLRCSYYGQPDDRTVCQTRKIFCYFYLLAFYYFGSKYSGKWYRLPASCLFTECFIGVLMISVITALLLTTINTNPKAGIKTNTT